MRLNSSSAASSRSLGSADPNGTRPSAPTADPSASARYAGRDALRPPFRARPRDHEPATARSVHASSCSPACPFWPHFKANRFPTGRHEHPDHLPCHRRSRRLSSTATCRRNGRDRRFTSNNSGLQHLWRESSTTAPPRPQRSGAPRRIRPDRGPSSPATAHWTARARTVRPRIRRTPGAISWRRERDGTDAVLDGLRDVLVGRLSDIGRRFSAVLADAVPHTALVIFTRECTGVPARSPAIPRSSTG